MVNTGRITIERDLFSRYSKARAIILSALEKESPIEELMAMSIGDLYVNAINKYHNDEEVELR